MPTTTENPETPAPAASPARGLAPFFGWVVERRRAVLLLFLVLGIAGAITFASLKRDLFPNLALPTLQLMVQSPGRAPAELEEQVARRIEQALLGVPGVRKVDSTVQAGITQVIIGFEEGIDAMQARLLVSERVSAILPELPPGTGAPLLTSAAGRLQEMLEIVLEGKATDPMVLRDIAERQVVPQLRSLPGVARIEVLGGQVRQLQIAISAEKMRLAGVSLSQIRDALEGSESNTTAGQLETGDKLYFLTLARQAAGPDEVRRLPVHTAHGLVALGDLAEVREAPEPRWGLARFDGFEAVSLRVVKQPQAEVLATAEEVRRAIADLGKTLPEGVSARIFYDQGELVSHALEGVLWALALGSLLVAAVLLLFLADLRAATIVLLILPLAIFGAALPLRFFGLGLDAMTLGGLAIAVGLLVDAGVILVENLAHRIADAARGQKRAALIAAASEVAPPILFSVSIILVVFLPLLAIGGVAGRLYAPLAISVASAMAISLLAALTFAPALADYLLRAVGHHEPRVVTAAKALYRPALELALRLPKLVMLAAALLAAGAFALSLRLPSDFLPALDEGALMVQTAMPADASLLAVDQANLEIEEKFAAVDGVRSVYRRTGRGELTEDPMPHYLSDVLVMLDPGADTEAVGHEIEELLEPSPLSGEVTTPMGMRIAEGIGGTPAEIQVQLFHPDKAVLRQLEAQLLPRLAEVEGVVSLRSDAGGMLPQWRVIPNEEALRRLDVDRGELEPTLQAALQGIELEPRVDGPQEIGRVLRFPADGRLSPSAMARLPLVVEEGRIVELGQVATFEETLAESMVRRAGGQRRLGINIQTAGDIGGTAKKVEAALRAADLPPGTSFRLAGQVAEARETKQRLLEASLWAVALVGLLLFAALRSAKDVLVVVSTLPVALAGGLLALVVAGESWNASSIVGLLGLFGVALQNSLVLIRQTRDLEIAGLPPARAVREAAVGRLRPKLMTAGAAALGLLPMLFGFAGSELEKPLAVVMVGGLVTSTLFTLLVLPSVLLFTAKRS